MSKYKIIDYVKPTIQLSDGTIKKVWIKEGQRYYYFVDDDEKKYRIDLKTTPVYHVSRMVKGGRTINYYLDEATAVKEYKKLYDLYTKMSKEPSKTTKYKLNEHPFSPGNVFSKMLDVEITVAGYPFILYVSVTLAKFVDYIKQN